jgi:hypothetical protein
MVVHLKISYNPRPRNNHDIYTSIMAFTISHAVLAPLLHKISAQRLPVAALAIGCMAPDLHRLFTQQNYLQAHQWSGIFTFSLWVGLAFCVLWYLLYRPMIYSCLGLKHELALKNFKQLLIFSFYLIIAVLLGIVTHLIWDGLTHVDFRTFAFHDFLSQSVTLLNATYPMHRVLQIGTSLLALPFIGWMSWHYYRSHHCQSSSKYKLGAGLFIVMVSLGVGLFSMLDYARYIPDHIWQQDLYYFTGRSINEFSQGFLSCFSLAAVLFLFLNHGKHLD